MSRLAPIGIPIEVATNLSVERAMRKLRAATRVPRGFSIMSHRRIVGSVSGDRVVLRRGTIRGWPESRNYGEFRGHLVDHRGTARLTGRFVEVGGSRFVVALAAALAVITTYFWLHWSASGFVVFGVSMIFLSTLSWLGGGTRRKNFSAEAELLVEDIKRALMG